jgi:hypothetical protein
MVFNSLFYKDKTKNRISQIKSSRAAAPSSESSRLPPTAMRDANNWQHRLPVCYAGEEHTMLFTDLTRRLP